MPRSNINTHVNKAKKPENNPYSDGPNISINKPMFMKFSIVENNLLVPIFKIVLYKILVSTYRILKVKSKLVVGLYQDALFPLKRMLSKFFFCKGVIDSF